MGSLDGRNTIIAEWCLVALALIFVLLRLGTRTLVQRARFNPGDYLVSSAWLCLLSMATCDTILKNLSLLESWRSYNNDLTHLTPDDPARNIEILKIIYGSALPYHLDLWLIKCAMLTFYYTIIPSTMPRMRIALYIITAIVLITMVMVLCINAFWCLPIERNWSLVKNEVCFSFASPPAFIISCGCNVITDFLIFGLPFPLLRNLRLRQRSQLFGLIFIFALGGFTILASIIRIIIIVNSATVTHVALWSALECAVGIVVASLPALRALIRTRRGTTIDNSNPSRAFGGSGTGKIGHSHRPSRSNWEQMSEEELTAATDSTDIAMDDNLNTRNAKKPDVEESIARSSDA